jgi:L-fuculose-phosphate aldolase
MKPATPVKDTPGLRRKVIQTCLELRDRWGLFVGPWGNASVRLETGILLTPTRMAYEEMSEEDLVVVGWDGRVVSGKRLPTSEGAAHRHLLRKRGEIGAFIHQHGPWSSVCACAGASIPVIVEDMAQLVGGEVSCSRYVRGGEHERLGQAAAEAIGPEAWAVLLQSHGAMCGGRDIEEAALCARILEKAALIWVQARALGGARLLPDESWRLERHRFLYQYGTAADFAAAEGGAPK